jgi:pimeloyl-ACP methyl ester carboxylesterase
MRVLLSASVLVMTLASLAAAQQTVSFPAQDGGHIYADLYGESPRALVLAHGGQFNRGSWRKQAHALEAAGFTVLAIDFRGYGQSTGPGQANPLDAPLHFDVLAAVRYMKKRGARTVSVIGGSLGGSAAGDASIMSAPGEIDRVVLLAAAPNLPAAGLKSRSLFIVARDDAESSGQKRLPAIRAQYDKAPQPKELIVVNGSAHAQHLFDTDQADRVMREILRFLSAR